MLIISFTQFVVSNYLDGRTGQQCLHRWQKSLNPIVRHGTWKEDEDKVLQKKYFFTYISSALLWLHIAMVLNTGLKLLRT